MSQLKRQVTATITAQDTFTPWMPVKAGEKVVVQVGGTITATVTPQMIFDGTTTGFDFGNDTLSAAGFKVIEAPVAGEVRAGVKSGAYTGGTIVTKVIAGG
ncbi:MAG: hypothetical protein AB7O45_02735 [Alphaproteobacteria bacterium]